MYWIHARMVWSHRIVLISTQPMLKGKLTIESHLILKHCLVLKQMCLRVSEHMAKPPELVGVSCNEVDI